MNRLLAAIGLSVFLALSTFATAQAATATANDSSQADCQFVFGFQSLRDLIGHDVVGECLENEGPTASGDGVQQQTTGGLLVWRQADNWTAFTDGYYTWVLGPNGVQKRLNSERFEWEADYAPGGGIATPTPAPTAVPAPTAAPLPTAAPMSAARPSRMRTAMAMPLSARRPMPRLMAPPAALKVDSFYRKHLDAGGLPIVASDKVMDSALYRARDIIDEMLAHRPELRATIAALGMKISVVAGAEVITDIPEFSDLYKTAPGVDWNTRVQGGGLAGNLNYPSTAVWAENLLCSPGDAFPYEDIFVHEFAHTVLKMGIENQPGGKSFRNRLENAFRTALRNGLWIDTYAAENADEYWAEGVQSWFGLNDPPGIYHNEINTRAELKAYDPTLANLIREVFGDNTITSSCHTTVDVQKDYRIQGKVVDANGRPLQGIVLWAWQGDMLTSGCEFTAANGTFNIKVPAGTFTLDIYLERGAGREFAGWFDGNTITNNRWQAATIKVTDRNVGGIVIRLPS